MGAITSDLKYALRSYRRDAWLRGRRHRYPGPRHRGRHGHLQRRRRYPASTASLPRANAAGEGGPHQRHRHDGGGVFSGGFPGREARDPGARPPRRLSRGHQRCHRYGRARTRTRRPDHGIVLRCAPGDCAGRAGLLGGGRGPRRGRGHQRRLVAATVRAAPRHRRNTRPRERHSYRDSRRSARVGPPPAHGGLVDTGAR